MRITATVRTPDFGAAIVELTGRSQKQIEYAAHVIGARVIAHLRSLTDEMRPPARAGEGMRRAHPGGWADVRGALSLGYRYEVIPTPTGAKVMFENIMEYAIYLELLDGYYVLSGIGDEGGVVETLLRETAEEFGWIAR